MPEFSGHNDLRAYLRVLWRWKFLFVLLVIAAPVAAYLLEHGKPKIYQSSALVGINQETVNSSLISGGGGFATTNVTAIAELVNTTPIAVQAAKFMTPPTTVAGIGGSVSASGDSLTNFLTITAQDRSAVRAAEIANAYAKAIALNQQDSAVNQLANAINGITVQLQRLPKNDPNRLSLQQELNQLQAARGTQGNEAAILQSAAPNFTPVGPHTRRAIELGLVIGLLLAFGVVVLAESADRRMRTPDDLENLTDLPLLATIGGSAFSGELYTTPVDEEAFQMLRMSLTYFNLEQQLHSVLITSPGEKEGKTTVATRLALAAARAGLNVVLVDADLRRAGVTGKLGIVAAADAGIGAVVTDQLDLAEALLEWPLDDDAEGRLRVLPAGPAPPNPSALTSSKRMLRLIKRLETEADLVIIDTPAALAVSDAVPLMRAVTGVVIVARMNSSTRETIRRLQKVVESAHGNLLGVIATGVNTGVGYEEYTRSYYAEETKRHRRRPFKRRQDTPLVLAPGGATSKRRPRPRPPAVNGNGAAPSAEPAADAPAAAAAAEVGAASAPTDDASASAAAWAAAEAAAWAEVQAAASAEATRQEQSESAPSDASSTLQD